MTTPITPADVATQLRNVIGTRGDADAAVMARALWAIETLLASEHVPCDDLVAWLRECHCDTCDTRLLPYQGFACSCPHEPAAARIEAHARAVAFFNKHSRPQEWAPSCFQCGKLGNRCVTHAELPNVYVCTECVASRRHEQELGAALRPFAAIKADDGDDFSRYESSVVVRIECTVGDILAARAAIDAALAQQEGAK